MSAASKTFVRWYLRAGQQMQLSGKPISSSLPSWHSSPSGTQAFLITTVQQGLASKMFPWKVARREMSWSVWLWLHAPASNFLREMRMRLLPPFQVLAARKIWHLWCLFATFHHKLCVKPVCCSMQLNIAPFYRIYFFTPFLFIISNPMFFPSGIHNYFFTIMWTYIKLKLTFKRCKNCFLYSLNCHNNSKR